MAKYPMVTDDEEYDKLMEDAIDLICEGKSVAEAGEIVGVKYGYGPIKMRTIYGWLRKDPEGYEEALAVRAANRIINLEKDQKKMRDKTMDPAVFKASLDYVKWINAKEDANAYGERKEIAMDLNANFLSFLNGLDDPEEGEVEVDDTRNLESLDGSK